MLGSSAYRYAQVRDFGVVSEDLSLRKAQTLGENVVLQFRLELLNAFNRHRLAGVETRVTSPLFGQVTNVSGHRTIQVGGRLDF
jgi:hypothetical protein